MSQRRSAPPGSPFNDAFRELAQRLGTPAAAPAAPAEVPPTASTRTPMTGAPPARAVVRLERKGRGGKEATVVEKLSLEPGEREAWLKELKRALGCGGALEGDALVLQGDLRARVKVLLEGRGVRKVTLG